ncbi:hypothetical protein ACH5RR_034092 [Cinchona calisaya]|uniref:Uncharacterized protein n=1 Tax=Cinchona calisaya TaxID=153742 RepID=A0ABD2YC25_9GENT
MVKGSCSEEVGVCVLDGRMGRLTSDTRARNLFDCIRSSREIGYFSGFLDSMGKVDEEEDEDERSRFCNLVDTEDVECLLGTYPLVGLVSEWFEFCAISGAFEAVFPVV